MCGHHSSMINQVSFKHMLDCYHGSFWTLLVKPAYRMTLPLMIASCSGPALIRYRNIKDCYYLALLIIYILKAGNYKYEIPMLCFDGARPELFPHNTLILQVLMIYT
jgi:hypothetical protein